MRRRTAVEFHQVRIEMAAAGAGFLDHRRQACGLRLKDLDLVADSGAGIDDEAAALVRVGRVVHSRSVAFPGGLVLQQLADLGKREARIVAQAADELQAIQVRRVIQAIVAFGAGRRLEQADLFVVADRARRQAGFGGDFLDPQQAVGGICHRLQR